MTSPAANPRGELLRLFGACAGLLAFAAALGSVANALRPAATRLPWVGDWDRHIETLAFRAGIPVTFLNGARTHAADPDWTVLDARSPAEYETGHLPRALNLPMEEADRSIGDQAARLTPQTPLLIYCGESECGDALELALKLRGWGFTDLTLYPGGYAEWVEYGGPIRTGGAP